MSRSTGRDVENIEKDFEETWESIDRKIIAVIRGVEVLGKATMCETG